MTRGLLPCKTRCRYIIEMDAILQKIKTRMADTITMTINHFSIVNLSFFNVYRKNEDTALR
jgi:hypothetical protein